VLGFALILFGFSFVSAGACEDGQTIMRLYSPINSHVSVWNESVSSYLEEICYDDIFGVNYTGSDPHLCDPVAGNRVLSLHNTSNSHAANTSDINYNHDVCYGDLSCVYDTITYSNCSNGGEIVARMFSGFNTHVSNASDFNYPVKVCCMSPFASRGVYWADMNGLEISQANITNSVKLIAKGVSSGSFVVWDEDLISDDEIITITGESVDSDLVGIWEISQADYNKANDIGEDFNHFYFKINTRNSSYLSIGDESDSPMNIVVTSPECGAYYDENETLNIVVNATDSDDEIDGTIKIKNGAAVLKEFDFTNNDPEFLQYFYFDLTTPGSLQVLTEASNSKGKGLRVIDNIMVLDKAGASYIDTEYVAACITEPEDLSRIDGTLVNFSASATRGLRVVSGLRYLLVPENGDIFSWNWTFMSPGIPNEYANFIDTDEIIAYNFTRNFFSVGDNSASLIVGVNAIGADGTCIDGGLCP